MSEKAAAKFDVLLPAAGRIEGEYARAAGHEIKALIDFNGRTVLERTIAALRDTGKIARGRVIASGAPELAFDIDTLKDFQYAAEKLKNTS